MHGANEARFRSFINQCLGNKFNTHYVKWRKRPLSNPGNLSFEADADMGLPTSSAIRIQSTFGKLDAGAGNARSRD